MAQSTPKRAFLKALDIVLVVLMAGIVLLVFSNVVLRYAFNSGLVVSEELSRYFFVWIIFIGAVATFYSNEHLGVELLVARLSPRWQKLMFLLSNIVILICCAVLFHGTYVQLPISSTMKSPVTGWPLSVMSGVTLFTAVGVAVIAIARIVAVLRNRVSTRDMDAFVGNYSDEPGQIGRAE